MNPYRTAQREHAEAQIEHGQHGVGESATGFITNMTTASSAYFREDASISEVNNHNKTRLPRNQNLDEMVASGEIPREISDSFIEQDFDFSGVSYLGQVQRGEMDYGALAEWAELNGHDIQNDDQLDEGLRESLREKREEDADIYRRADGGGKAGMIAGGFIGAGADPLNLLAMVIPGTQTVAGGRVATAMARGAVSAAASNVAVEAVLQAQVVPYKDKIDSPYDWTDGLVNMAFAGVAGGVLGGALGGASQGVANRVRGQNVDAAVRNLDEQIKDVAPDTPEAKSLNAQREALQSSRAQEPEFKAGTTQFGAADELGFEARDHARIRAEAAADRNINIDGVETSSRAEVQKATRDREQIEAVIGCMLGGAASG